MIKLELFNFYGVNLVWLRNWGGQKAESESQQIAG